MKRVLITILLGIGILSAQEIKIKGEVIEKREVFSEEYNTEIVELSIKTEDGKIVIASLCPKWFLSFDIQKGEKIELLGRFREQEQFRFMVREIIKNEFRYQIRDRNYNPLWIRTPVRMRNCFYNPQTEVCVKGKIKEICIVSPYSLLVEANIALENGEIVRLRLAPSWYLRERIKVGDEIEVRGSQIRLDGEKMIMVREMQNLRTREIITLRDMQGFPLWSGYRKGEGGVGRETGRKRRGRW